MNNMQTEKSKQKNEEFIPNFTQYPNEILDNWMPHLSGNQTKIINVFVRQIYGYHKEYDRISIRQISQKTGISISKVFKDVKSLISIGCIKILKKGNKNDAHLYQILNITEELPQREHSRRNKGVTPEVTGCYPIGNSCVTPEVTEELPQREQQKKEINYKETVEIKETSQNLKQQKTDLAHTSKIESYSVEKLLEKSNNFLQQVGFGFSKNPRYILDQIYKLLPDDYQVKEDAKDVDILKQAIERFESGSGGDRDAISKKLFQGVEAMAKLYLIKKYGEEFRDVLYPKILNDNLILYLNCNPTLKYCLQGFSNDIDGVYSEITRIVKKRQEQEERDRIKEEQRYLERERIKAEAQARPHFSDDDIHALGLRTVPELLQAMQDKGSNIDLLDKKYQATDQTITDTERERLGELLRIKMTNGNLDLSEENEFLNLNRKMKGNG
jgi:DNA-binding Lrp family transcriptional regulator